MNRHAVRDRFETRFTASRMAADYIRTFEAQLHSKTRIITNSVAPGIAFERRYDAGSDRGRRFIGR
jgi:hypothetical protein